METGILTTIKHMDSTKIRFIRLYNCIEFSYMVPMHNNNITFLEYTIIFDPTNNIITYEVDTVPRIARNTLKNKNGLFVASKEDITSLFKVINEIRNKYLLKIRKLMFGSPDEINDVYIEGELEYAIRQGSVFIENVHWIC